MAIYAVIEAGKVINIVVADEAISQEWIILANEASIGWDYIDGQFVNNTPAEVIPLATPPSKDDLMVQLQALTAQINALL